MTELQTETFEEEKLWAQSFRKRRKIALSLGSPNSLFFEVCDAYSFFFFFQEWKL